MVPSKDIVRALLFAVILAAASAVPFAVNSLSVGAAPIAQAPTRTPPSTPPYAAHGQLINYPAASVQQAAAGDVVISQFRTRNASDPTDEFIELFNRSCTDTFDLNGWSVKYSDNGGTTGDAYAFSSSVLLGPGQYYLLATNATVDAVSADVTYPSTLSDDGGFALIRDDGTTIIDQVGLSSDSAYLEGAALAPMGDTTEESYQRKTAPSGMYLDSHNNASDFGLISPSLPHNSGDSAPCGIPTPTPTNTATFTPSPTNTPTATSTPNCALTPTPDPYGALSIIINEVGWAGTNASSSDEWLELYNPGTCPVNMNHWSILGLRAGNVTQFTIDFAELDVVIPAGGYLVIEASDEVFTANVPNLLIATNLALLDTGMNLELIGPPEVGSGPLVDHANFSAICCNGWPAGSTSGRRSMERYRPSTDTRTNWISFYGSTSPSNWPRDRNGGKVNGTPGRANWAYDVTKTPAPAPTKGRTPTPLPPTPFAHMVINEFLPRAGTDWNQDGAIDVYDEFIEIKNLGPIDGSIGNWRLNLVTDAGSTTYNLPATTLRPGDRLVYYGKTSGLHLPDSGGTVRLLNTRSTVIDARGYGPVANPDQSHCRIPDGYYWRFPCFPTPGLENVLQGAPPAPPPVVSNRPPPCLLPDIAPAPFRDAECNGYGADVWNPAYWDDQAGFAIFRVPDALVKWVTTVK
jgi:hypothetical protein